MKKYALIYLCVVICLFAGYVYGDSTIISQVRIHCDSEAGYHDLLSRGLDIIGGGDDYLEFFANRQQIEDLQIAGYHIDVVHDDVVKFYQSRLADKPMGAYKTLSEINSHIDSLISQHPDLISQKISLGKTYEGRDIWAFKVSDNPNLDEDEPELLYTACIHAREVITPEVLFYFINYLVDNYDTLPEVAEVVDNTQLWFIPIVNPDGYYYNEVTNPYGGGYWRKNRKPVWDGYFGIDLNRNYSFRWAWDRYGSSSAPSSYTYRGPKPFSEEETRALRDFSMAHNFVSSLYVHSKGDLFMYPWGYTFGATPDDDLFAVFGDSVNYFNGYTAGQEYSTIYPVNGGAQDWHYGETEIKQRSAAFILEVGTQSDGFWPPAERIPVLVQENLMTCMVLARNAETFATIQGPETPQLSISDSVAAAEYEITWSASDGPINPAVDYVVEELFNPHIGTDYCSSFDNWQNHWFSTSVTDYVSPPSSFYGGGGSLQYKYFQSIVPYHVLPGDTLRFDAKYDIEENYDFAYVEVSSNGLDFSPIPGNITTDVNVYGSNRGHGITGKSYLEEWVEAAFDLSAYEGMDIYIRFTYQTDQETEGYGIFIDDIRPALIWDSVASYGSGGDTSMTFTEKPHGVYYYRVKARDAESDWSVYSPFDSTVVYRGYMCGDANGDESINIGDAVFLISYIFKNGPPPEPVEAGDANCSNEVNVGDVVYLVNYVFRSGPEPCCSE